MEPKKKEISILELYKTRKTSECFFSFFDCLHQTIENAQDLKTDFKLVWGKKRFSEKAVYAQSFSKQTYNLYFEP